jgi:hypothetical protein
MDIKMATDVADNIVTSTAIVTGGFWAYFKFIRGRAFAHRAEIDISPTVESGAGSLYLSITITLKNTGLSKLPLNEKMKILRLSGITGHSGGNPGAAGWERILSLPILKDHGWLEAQETVTETVVYSVGGPDGMGTSHAAYQVEAMVGTPRRMITKTGKRWQSHAVIFLPSTRSVSDSSDVAVRSANKRLTNSFDLEKGRGQV